MEPTTNDGANEGVINPGELALASIGISPIIRGEMPKIGLGRLQDIGDIPNKVTELAGLLADGKLTFQPYAHEHKYMTLLERLTNPLKQHEIAELIGKFHIEAGDIGAQFAVAVQEALRDLKEIFPVSVYRTFAGPTNLEPNANVIFEFLNRLDVVNDPLRVFPLMATGALLKSQAAMVKKVYPTLSEHISRQIYAAVAKRRAASPPSKLYELPPRAEIGVGTWVGRKAEFRPPRPNPPPPAQDEKSQLPKMKQTGPQQQVVSPR